MGNIIILAPIHSVADIITNSSSELFICNTDKDLKDIDMFFDKLSGIVGDVGVGYMKLYDGPIDLLKTLMCFSYYIDAFEIISILGMFINSYRGELKEELEELRVYLYRNNKDDDMPINWWVDDGYVENWFYKNEKKLRNYIGKFVEIKSRGDNSIPYDIFDIISNRLNAKRIHLG